MASHGPSFRFAAPRPKEQQVSTTGPASRLPLRNLQEPDAPTKPTERIPAKLRRKNIPDNVKARLAAQDSNISQSPDAAAARSATDLSRPTAIPSTSMKPARRLFPSKTPEVVACVVTPTSSFLSGPSNLTPESPKSNTLRRKPSVIGRYVSSRRKEAMPEKGPDALSLDTPREHARTTATARVEESRLRSPFESLASRASPIDRDANNNWYPMTTPISEQSTTPSLRYTDSPSVFSHAATATPTSQTSHSPYIAHSPHFGPGAWNSPVKSIQDLRLGHDDLYSPSSLYVNEKSNESLSLGNQHPTNLVPELAHLMIDAVLPQTTDRKPPVRPSRDGTPSLDIETSPVVISNLPRLSAGHHRRQSSSSAPESVSRSDDGAEQKGGLSPPKRSSFNYTRPSTSDGKAPPLSHSIIPENGTLMTRPSSRPTESPKPPSRFGFLHRKDKAEQIASQEEAARQLKKGPMAGTGHEGYGKYAAKGRNGSSVSVNSNTGRPTSFGNSSQTSSNRKSNSGSAKSDAGPDDFIAQRLAPVYIRGGSANSGGQSNLGQFVRSDSSSSLADDEQTNGSSVNSPNPSNASRSSFDPSKPPRKTTPLSAATSVSSRAPSSRGRGSWGSVNRGPDRRSSKEHGSESARIQEETKQNSAAGDGGKAEHQDDAKTKKSNWSFFSKSSPAPKQSQKWNPFQRSHSSPPKAERIEQSSVAMEAPESPRTVAHYAMPEENKHFDFKELEDLMEEADALQTDYQSDFAEYSSEPGQPMRSSQEENLVYNETAQILASHLKLSPELSKEHAESGLVGDKPSEEPTASDGQQSMDRSVQPRPSRLAQVGRIPKVVSRRDRLRKLPDQSFSRPFAESQPRPSLGSPDLSSGASVSDSFSRTSNVPSIQAQVNQLRANKSISTLSKTSTQDLEQNTSTSREISRGSATEFFAMPNRKDSDLSFSSSSGTPYFPSAASTAVVPSAVSPVSEDEVWQEYDDLIDHVLTPVVSNGAGAPETRNHGDYFSGQQVNISQSEEPLARSKTAFPKLGDMASSLRPDLSPFLGTRRRSQVFSGFEHPAISPMHAPGVIDEHEDATSPKTPKAILNHGHYRDQSSNLSLSIGDVSSGINAMSPSSDIGDLDNADALKLTPKSMANLRFGALMTSKWLSFGRVLFSPGHSQLGSTVSDRILVIDGLGKDWSYYCALTYPNASIYSLGPEPARSSNRQSLSQWQTLTNHRHFSHANIATNFPFPKNFFAVVVFRFPVAVTEADLRASLCECKRVLQPGGYIEVSALDLDLTNMGNKARRAVRELKTKMQSAIPDVCLKPASDNIQCLLGRRGFENLNRCVVGVPAAGAISESRNNSHDEREMSFTELAADTTKTGDAAMTKLVAKVGRWWYMKTYETCVLPGGDVLQSIWNDTALLRECEINQTTFKLLVCYAQKPAMAKRRTVSL